MKSVLHEHSKETLKILIADSNKKCCDSHRNASVKTDDNIKNAFMEDIAETRRTINIFSCDGLRLKAFGYQLFKDGGNNTIACAGLYLINRQNKMQSFYPFVGENIPRLLFSPKMKKMHKYFEFLPATVSIDMDNLRYMSILQKFCIDIAQMQYDGIQHRKIRTQKKVY